MASTVKIPPGWPRNRDGEPYPYDPIVNQHGEPIIGKTIDELVARVRARGAEERTTVTK